MDKDKQSDEGDYHLERFLPIRPRPVPTSASVTTASSSGLPNLPELAEPEGSLAGATSAVTFTRGAGAPPLSTVYSQLPVMVVNPMQHQKSSVETVTLSTQSISTCASSNSQTATSTASTSAINSLQLVAQRPPGNITVQGSPQNSGIVLGNSFPSNILPGSFMPNQLIQTSPFMSNVLVTPSVQGGIVQGNFAQGFALSGGLMPFNQVQFGIQNTPQFSSCLLRLPGQSPQVTLPTVSSDSGNTRTDVPIAPKKPVLMPASTKSPYQFVIEPDPAFDMKLKGATIMKDRNSVSESSQSASDSSVPSKETKNKSNAKTEEEFLPKIENCYSMKKLSLKEMIELLDEGHNVMTFVKPGTNDYYRAKILCEAVVKYHITSIRSDMKDDFFTSLVSPYISLREALCLKNEIKFATKGNQKQRKIQVEDFHVSKKLTQGQDSDEEKKPSGIETAASILKWRTEKLENIDPALFRQLCSGDENPSSGVPSTTNEDQRLGNKVEISGIDSSQKQCDTSVRQSETDTAKKDKMNKFNQSDPDHPREETSGNPDCRQRQKVAHLELTGHIPSEKTTESDAKFVKETHRKKHRTKQCEREADVIRKMYDTSHKISKENESECPVDAHRLPKSKQKETESEAELIRKAFTLSKFKHTENSPSSTYQFPFTQTSISVNPEFMKTNENSSQNQRNFNRGVSVEDSAVVNMDKNQQGRSINKLKDKSKEGSRKFKESFENVITIPDEEEIIHIKSEPYEDMQDSEVAIPFVHEKNCKHTDIEKDKNRSSKTPNRTHSVSSKEMLSGSEIEPKRNISSASSKAKVASEENEKNADTNISLRKPENIPENVAERENTLLSNSDRDTVDVAGAGGSGTLDDAAKRDKHISEIQLPDKFILGKWNQGTQKFSDKILDDRYCYLCGLFFPNPEMTWRHIVNDHSKLNKPSAEFPEYICTHCYQIFQSYGAVRQHEMDVHLCEFPCYFCGLTIDDSFTMLQHVAAVHSKLFTCDSCQGQFLGKWEFQKHCISEEHKQKKTDISNFILLCLFCNGKFDCEMTLASHLIQTHIGKPLPNSKECVCQSCRHQFLDARALLSHRNSDARKVEKPRPLSTASLVELAIQVIKSKETAETLKRKQKRSNTSHCSIDDFIRKNVSNRGDGYRELIIGHKKCMYPFRELLIVCELGSDIPAEASVVVMDALIKFLVHTYPNLQIDTTNNDLHFFVAAVSRSQKFTQLLRTFDLKSLPWTDTIQKTVKAFLKRVQAGCYKNATLTDLCASLQKCLNFLQDRQNPTKQTLPTSTERTVAQGLLPSKNQVAGNSDLSHPSSSGIAHTAAQALNKTVQPTNSETASISSGHHGSSNLGSNTHPPSSNAVSVSETNISAQVGIPSTEASAGPFQLVQMGMNFVLVPAGQNLNPNPPARQSVGSEGIAVQNLKAIGANVTKDQNKNASSAPTFTGLPSSLGQSVVKVQSEVQTGPLAGRKESRPVCSVKSKGDAADVEEAKKLIPIAPKGRLLFDPNMESVEIAIKNQNIIEKKRNKSKNKSSDSDSDAEDVPAKELTDLDSLVARSKKLKHWFYRIKKPVKMGGCTIKKEKLPAIPAKICTNINEKEDKEDKCTYLNENEDKTDQKNRKLVVNNRLKRLITKRKGFQIADKYRTQAKKSAREVLTKGMENANSKVESKRKRLTKASKLMQSYDQVLRKRKPVKYTFEEDDLIESDEETVVPSSAESAESEEEWKPSDIESEEEFSDGVPSDGNEVDDDFDATANTKYEEETSSKDTAGISCSENEGDNIEIEKKPVSEHSRSVNNLNNSVTEDIKNIQEYVPMEIESDYMKKNSVSDSTIVETGVVKQKKVPISKKLSQKKLLTDMNRKSLKDLTENETLSYSQSVCLKRYAPGLLKEYVPSKFLKVANSVEGLHCCTIKMPWLNTFLKCGFVKLERNVQADRLGLELVISVTKDCTERKLTRSFVKRLCQEDKDMEGNKMHAQKPEPCIKDDIRLKIDTEKSVNAFLAKTNNVATPCFRGRGRPRKNMNKAEESSITEKDIPKKEADDVHEGSDKSVYQTKKLRPRKKFSYFEEDSSDTSSLGKSISDDSPQDVFQKGSSLTEDKKTRNAKLEAAVKGSSVNKHEEKGNAVHETEMKGSSLNEDGDLENKEHGTELSASYLKCTKLTAGFSPEPSLIYVTNTHDVNSFSRKDKPENVIHDERGNADFVTKETKRMLKRKCDDSFLSKEAKRMLKRKCLKEEGPSQKRGIVSKDVNISVCKKGETETDLTISPLQIKQEIEDPDYFKGSASVTVLVPPQQKKSSDIVTTLGQILQNPTHHLMLTSADFLKNADTEKQISSQLSSSSLIISPLSAVNQSPALITQAASTLVTSNCSVTKQVNKASPQTTKKPNILQRQKRSQQVVNPISPALQITRYPVLVQPHSNSNVVPGLSSALPSAGSAFLRGPPPLVKMSSANDSLANIQPAVLQTTQLGTSANQSINYQMQPNQLSALGNLTQKFGLNQSQMQQMPISQPTQNVPSPVLLLPISGTNQFIPINIAGGLNSVVQTEQLQKGGQTHQTNHFQQTQQTNQFQQAGQIQPVQVIQTLPQIGQMPVTNFSASQQLPVQQNQQQQIANSEINSQCSNSEPQSSNLLVRHIKQEANSQELTNKEIPVTKSSVSNETQSSGIETSQLQQSVETSSSEQLSTAQIADIQQTRTNQSPAVQGSTNQGAIVQPLPSGQPMAQMQGVVSNHLPFIQTGQVQVPGMQQVLGMAPNQFQGINQSGQIVQGFQFSQTGVQQVGNTGQTQQQKIPLISPQGTSHTLMVNQQMPLAPGQLIYVPDTTGSGAVHTGQILSSAQAGSILPVVQSEKSRNKTETTSDGQCKEHMENTPVIGQVINPAQKGNSLVKSWQVGEAQQAGKTVTALTELEKVQALEEHVDDIHNQDEAIDSDTQTESQTCSKCLRCFKDAEVYTAHLQMHSEGRYFCYPCNQYFQDKFDYLLHKALKHCKTFTCGLCNETFNKGTTLFDHIYLQHKKPAVDVKKNIRYCFSCCVCCQVFLHERSLRIHLAKHFGGFFCKVCGNQSETAESFENHCVNKHGKCYACNLCKESFDSKCQVTVHISSNHKVVRSFSEFGKFYSTFYTCKKCKKRFQVDREEEYAYVHYKYEHTYENDTTERDDWCDSSDKYEAID